MRLELPSAFLDEVIAEAKGIEKPLSTWRILFADSTYKYIDANDWEIESDCSTLSFYVQDRLTAVFNWFHVKGITLEEECQPNEEDSATEDSADGSPEPPL